MSVINLLTPCLSLTIIATYGFTNQFISYNKLEYVGVTILEYISDVQACLPSVSWMVTVTTSGDIVT